MDCLLIKLLTFDIARLLKDVMAAKSTDAQGCYDCIVPHHASLPDQQAGMPATGATANYCLMKETKKRICTTQRLSPISIATPRSAQPRRGAGQDVIFWHLDPHELLHGQHATKVCARHPLGELRLLHRSQPSVQHLCRQQRPTDYVQAPWGRGQD